MKLRKLAMWMLALVMVPAGGMASGSWFTVTEDLSAETLMLPNDEYTGTVTMTFLGDCTLGGEEKKAKNALSFASRIAENGMDFPFRGLKHLTESDDLTVANLEVVLSDRKLKKEKKEFNFIGPTAYTQILTDGDIECVTVANNHTHDYGEEGYTFEYDEDHNPVFTDVINNNPDYTAQMAVVTRSAMAAVVRIASVSFLPQNWLDITTAPEPSPMHRN